MDIKIIKIAYEACFNIGNYENEKIRFEAELGQDSDLKESVELLRQRAIQCAQPDANEAWNERYKIQKDISELKALCEQWRKKWTATADFLKAQGIRPDCPEMPAFLAALPVPATEEVVTGEIEDEC